MLTTGNPGAASQGAHSEATVIPLDHRQKSDVLAFAHHCVCTEPARMFAIFCGRVCPLASFTRFAKEHASYSDEAVERFMGVDPEQASGLTCQPTMHAPTNLCFGCDSG
jgi:hypothetical protein